MAILLCAGFFLVLALPLLRGDAPLTAENETAATLASVLTQIEADRAAGLIGDTEAEEAVIDAKRAALGVKDTAPEAHSAKAIRFAGIAFLAAAPLLVGGIYLQTGNPEALNPDNLSVVEAPPTPAETIAAMAPQDRLAAIEGMVAGLAARLEDNPEDVEGWRMLAKSYGALNQPQKSVEAYQEILKRSPGTRDDFRDLAMTLIAVHGEGGDTDGTLATVLETTLEKFPGDPLALYQLAALKRAVGDPQAAVALWRKLLVALPSDAPVRPALEKLIVDAESESAPVQ